MEKSFLEDFKFEENKRTFNFQLIDKNILELKEEISKVFNCTIEDMIKEENTKPLK